MPDPVSPIDISYQSGRDPLKIRVTRWLASQPAWRIAIGLMVIALLPYAAGLRWYLPPAFRSDFVWKVQLFLPFIALFLPGSIQRLNWRQGAMMLVFAGAALAIENADLMSRIGYPYDGIDWQIPLAGVAYWVVSRRGSKSELVMIFALCSAIALLVPTIVFFSSRAVTVPLWHGGNTEISLMYISNWLLMAPLTWKALELAQGPKRPRLAAVALIAGVVWFPLFYNLIVYQLARISIVNGSPIPRGQALWYLGRHQHISDDAALWRALETANWSLADETTAFEPDYRETCIHLLSERDRASTAQKLSSLLRNHPAALLANDAAAVLAREHRYETAPELMRYALLDAMDCQNARAALVSWTVPQASLAILRFEAVFKGMLTGTAETNATALTSETSRSDLSRLLGKDVGTRWQAWVDLYFATIAQRQSPLPAETQLEVNRIVVAVERYWTTAGQLERSGRSAAVPKPNLDVPGTSEFEAEIKKFTDAANGTQTQSAKHAHNP